MPIDKKTGEQYQQTEIASNIDIFNTLDDTQKEEFKLVMEKQNEFFEGVQKYEEAIKLEKKFEGLEDAQKNVVAEIGNLPKIEGETEDDYAKRLSENQEKYIEVNKEMNALELLNTPMQRDKRLEKEWAESELRLDNFGSVAWLGIKNLAASTHQSLFDKDGEFINFNWTGLTEEQSQRYNELQKERRELEKPLAKKFISKLKQAKKEAYLEGSADIQVYLESSFKDSPEEQKRKLQADPTYVNNKMGYKTKEEYFNGKSDEDITLEESVEYFQYITDLMPPGFLAESRIEPINAGILEASDKIDELESFLKDENSILSGLLSQKKDLGTAGLYSLYKMGGALKNVQDTDENTNPSILAYNKIFNLKQQAEQIDVTKDRGYFKLGQGTAQSVVFLEQSALTGGVSGLVSNGVKFGTKKLATNFINKQLMQGLGRDLTKGQLKKIAAIELVEKGVINTGKALGVAVQAMAMPNTYTLAGTKFIGQTQAVTDENGEEKILVSNSSRKAYLKSANNETAILTEEINRLEKKEGLTKEEEKIIADKKQRLIQIEKEVNSLYDPSLLPEPKENESEEDYYKRLEKAKTEDKLYKDISVWDAGFYGYTESLKELAAERFVGAGVDKLGKAARIKNLELKGKYGTYNKVSNAIGTLGKPVNYVANKVGNLKNTHIGKLTNNAMSHVGAGKLFHGLPAEILEEVAVQLTPTYQEDYIKQLEELTHSQFYIDVIAQTLLMGGLFQAPNTITNATKYATSKKYRKADKEGKERKRNIRDLYKAIDKSIDDDSLAEHIIMNSNGSLFETQDYRARIAKLRTEGKDKEADKLENKSFYNLATEALVLGEIENFEKTLEKIQYNPTLSEATKTNAALMIQDVAQLKEIEANHKGKVNYGTILKHSINQISNEKTIKELSDKIVAIEIKANKELDKHKDNFDNFDEASAFTLSDMATKLKNDVDGKYTKFIAKLQKQNVEGVNELLSLHNTRDLYKEIDFENYVNLRYELDPNNQKAITERENNRVKEKPESETKENLRETIAEVAPAENTVEQAASEFVDLSLELDNAEPTETDNSQVPDADSFADEAAEFDFMLASSDGTFNQEGIDAMANKAIHVVEEFKKEHNRKPSFEEFIDLIVSRMGGDRQTIKGHLQSFGFAWERADLGKSNWKELYNSYYNTMNNVIDAFLNTSGVDEISSETKENIENNSEKEIESSTNSTPITENPLTGEPIKKTINRGKTFITNHKANYAAVRYKVVKVETENGTLIRYENDPVPVLTDAGYTDFRHLVNPNKNNIGDKLTATEVGKESWDEIQVAVRNNTGEVDRYISFADWINTTIPSNMSIEDFMLTDTFIEKVPMVYKDSQGNPVAFVPEVEWYNPFTVGDVSKDSREEINISNPTATHLNTINRNKENTRELRKGINSGRITQVEITDNTSFPLIKIDEKEPSKKLSTVAPGSTLAFFNNNGTIINLGGEAIDKSNILNIESISSSSREETSEGLAFDKFDNAGHTLYLSHVTTIDGVKKYVALNVLRKNEEGNNEASKQDLETAKWMLSANKVLNDKQVLPEGHSYFLTKEQATEIKNRVQKETGKNIINLGTLNDMIKGMFYHKGGNFNDNKYIYKLGDALFSGKGTFTQNTSINYNNIPVVAIEENNEGGFKIEKIAPDYDGYLKERLSTNIMSYNVGTESNPIYTPAVQQTVILTPIVNEEVTLTEKFEEAVEDTKVEENSTTEAAISEAEALAKILNIEIDEDVSDDLLTPELDNVNNIEESVAKLKGLTINQQQDLVAELVSLLSKQGVTEAEVKNKFINTLKEKKSLIESQLINLKSLNPNSANQKLTAIINALEVSNNQIDIVLNNYEDIYTKARAITDRVDFTSDEIQAEDEVEMNEKDYSKSNSENRPIEKVGVALKRIFASVPNGKTGFLGINKYDSFKSMYDNILSILASDIGKKSDFNYMMSKLEIHENSFPWIKDLIKELKNSPTDVKNQFVYNFYKHAVKGKFVGFTYLDGDGRVESSLWDSNANTAERVIVNKWKNNFRRSPINVNGKINTTLLKRLASDWNSWGNNPHKQPSKVLRAWLSNFGIEVSDKTWKAIQDGELYTKQNKKFALTSFESLFKGSGARNSNLFFNLVKYAFENKDKDNFDFIDNHKNHPFEDMNDILKQLSKLEAKYNPTYISSTRRIAGKTVSEVESVTYFYEQTNKLKHSALTDKEYINKLRGLEFSSNSMLLSLLKNDSTFAQNFETSFQDLLSLKELYKKDPMFAGIDELSNIDYMFVQRAMLQNRRQGTVTGDFMGFPMRMGTLSTPTNSDKGRMMMMKTAILDLYANSKQAFNVADNGEITFTKELKELLFNQLVEPEIKRALKHKKTNIKNYDKGAARINLIPGLNSLNSENKETKTLGEMIASKSSIEEIKTEYIDLIGEFLEKMIKQEASRNVKRLSDFSNKVDSFNNADYLSKREGSVLENMYVAELDYIINSMIGNMNTFQAIAGDPAIYFKSKGDITDMSKSNQVKISKEVGINLGKRLAMMIAPGDILADSDNNKYLQIFMEDPEEVAQNAEDIITWHYGKEALEETFNNKTYREILNDLRAGTVTKENLESLNTRFNSVKDFFNIESADAQEFTTTKEHIYVLEKQGRLKGKFNDITKKIESQKKSEKEGKKINKEDLLSKEELDLVLQPIKPVYTGSIIDTKQDVNRIMYIKSSSFPLIPQLTVGTKLDNLRKKMEELEDAHKTTVRASYQTANKVGALTAPINPFNQTSLDSLDERNKDGVALHHIELNRKDFKIQQDVPFKSDKNEEDNVSLGTQIFKLLFGDGVMNMDGFKIDGEDITGEELQKLFHATFNNIVTTKKSKLLKKLGLDNDMKSENPEKTAKAIQRLVLSEAEARGFSEQDLNALTLEERLNNKGEKYFHFKLPLWFSANSNKYEAMFNAIINNKIFKQKIPGNKFVTGSEAGIQMSEDLSNIDVSRIIHINGYEGGELKGTNTKNDGLSKAEILVPSKFKLNGKLIDLFEDFNGTNGTYLTRNEKGFLEVKSDMIDSGLLDQFTFRIPTSSHGLGSTVTVAGFLPPESGDLVITPKNFITQMGQDFDIDSLTAYQYNHIVLEDGSIKKLSEDNREQYIAEKKKKLLELRELLRGEKRYGESINEFLSHFPDVDFGNSVEEEITRLRENLSKDFDLKILENKFIDIHNAVYSNPKMQSLINKALSMEFAESQAEGIDELSSNTSGNFSILSPNYQMEKMNLGSTGAIGIGIYAKGVTFHSLIQQAVRDNNRIGLTTSYMKDGKKVIIPKEITIGNITSTGDFGRINTLSSSKATDIEKKLARRISVSLDERANTATDNEKAQILGRVGLNYKDAIAVDSLLAILGIDNEINLITKGEFDSSNPFHKESYVDGELIYYTQHSLPYLLHSQPIIKEYFRRLSIEESITTNFNGNAKAKILNELIKKTAGEDYTARSGGLYNENLEVLEKDTSKFIAENLVNGIKLGNKGDLRFQAEVLALYVDLINEAKKTKDLMSVVDMNNLGKSMWESSMKAETLRNLLKNDDYGISNVNTLLGDYREEGQETTSEKTEVYIGDGMYFIPTTNQGVMVGNAISLSENLFSDYFPVNNTYINSIIDNIMKIKGVDEDNVYAVVKAKEQIFQEIKRYITSAQHNGIFTKPVTEVRKELYFDTKDNTSLSTYIAKLYSKSEKDFNKGIQSIRNNRLLSIMNYEMGESSKPSLIKFNNAEAMEMDQEYLYYAFKELILNDYALPDKNGESYSTRKLAQELVAYSFSGGGIIQGAIEFHKFIPMEYLDDLSIKNSKNENVPVTRLLQHYDTQNSDWGATNKEGKQRLTDFTKQYFQNNPSEAQQLSKLEIRDFVNFSKDGSFQYNLDIEDSHFISFKEKTKSKLKQDKWKLYSHVGNGRFERIDVAGATGMMEYEYGNEDLKSNVVTQTEKTTPAQPELGFTSEPKKSEDFGIEKKDSVKSVIQRIADTDFGTNSTLSLVAETLLPFINSTTTLEVIDDSNQQFAGRATIKKDSEVIIINKGIIDSNKVNLAKTMLHETIHTLTSRFINEYIDKEGNLLPNAPKELVSFNLLMNNYKKQIKDKYSEEFDVFMTKYKAHKSGDGQIPVGFTRKEIELFYPTINMKEFIATVLGNNEHFLEEAGQMKYLKSDLTIVQKFGKIVVDLLNKLKELSGLEHNLAEEAIIQSLNIIETIKVKNETVNNNINEEVSEFDIARYEEMYRLMDEQQNNEPDGLPAIKRTPKNCI